MKEKTKKILTIVLIQTFGVACDAALIHNFVRQDEWNVYCQRYITMFTIFSWVVLLSAIVTSVHVELAVRREDYRKKNADALKKSVETLKPKLWKTLWRWCENAPMIFFTAIFAGNLHLATLWLITTILIVSAERSAAKLSEIFKNPPKQTFSEVMEELSKKSNLN